MTSRKHITAGLVAVALIALSGAAFSQNAAFDVEAGPIWSQDEAPAKCARVVASATWTGHWKTTVPGKMSVCNCTVGVTSNKVTRDINAGPIWNQDHAKTTCPAVCSSAKWTGHWKTTVPSKMSVCNIAFGAR